MVDNSKSYTHAGDLHRIYIQPDERAVVSKDGKTYILPMESASCREEDQGDGVYVFRSNQFKIYGPEKKGKRQYQLGPITYFNVRVGEVAYGTENGALKVWEVGEHFVDNNKNEWFGGFFSTNVDPVEVFDFPVQFKHGINAHLDLFVSFGVTDPALTLQHYNNHDVLHNVVATYTCDQVFNICATKPPIGYTDLFFEGRVPVKDKEKDDVKGTTRGEILLTVKSIMSDHFVKLGIEVNEILIKGYRPDAAFVKASNDNALKLQASQREYEQAAIDLKRQEVENEKACQQRGRAPNSGQAESN